MKITSFLVLLISAIAIPLNGQMKKPTAKSMVFSASKVKVGDIVEVTVSMSPAPGMHIYSEKSTCAEDVGYTRASLTFSGDHFVPVGSCVGVGDQMKTDELAELDKVNCKTGVFPSKAIFKQKIKVTGTIQKLVCSFSGQMCDESQCVKIEETLEATSPVVAEGVEPIEHTPEIKDDTATSTKDSSVGQIPTNVLQSSYKDGNGNCTELRYTGTLGNTKSETANKGLGLVFWLAFTSGLLALLTPCVFPMIPMTVAFFLKNEDRKKSVRDGLVFAIAIILIYVIIGTLVSKLVGPDAANWLSTHWIPNVFFFVIFIVFAASFFGAFELVLPASWVNAIDKRADKGGIAGPVFMALTIALVSFSCTGPIVGTVLVESAKGGLSTPIIAMLGFSLAFALPFGLLVVFPSYMKSLPKSGGWLNSVKVVLGFIELAFALKFLSTADQTYHWGILDREVYLAFWIVIFSLMAIYLMGKIKFSHDSDIPYWSVTRLMLVITTWSFVVYLVPGLWGAPLKSLAGYLPPMHTQDFRLGSESEAGEIAAETCQTPKYSGELHIPHGIQGYFDYEEALACAKAQKKPVFIDFTGHGCVNCRKMEEKVWSNPDVLKILKNEYVVVSLYVDDKKIKLSEQEQFKGKFSGSTIKTLGDKNAEIQACYFNSNSQPLYVLMTGDEVLLQHPGSAESFDYNPEKFKVFLQNGITEFKKMQP
ncbi:MAG: protein-disulfide reductase DsbD family protein [Sphingomonadales bacterium]